MATWDSTAFLAGLSDACGLCVATGALHLWTQLLLGCSVATLGHPSVTTCQIITDYSMGLSDAMRAMTFDRHKVVMDITCAAWCEVHIEFVKCLLCEAVDAMFCL